MPSLLDGTTRASEWTNTTLRRVARQSRRLSGQSLFRVKLEGIGSRGSRPPKVARGLQGSRKAPWAAHRDRPSQEISQRTMWQMRVGQDTGTNVGGCDAEERKDFCTQSEL